MNNRALTQAEQDSGRNHINYANTVLRSGYLYQKLADYKKAEEVLLDGASRIEQLKGTDSPEFAFAQASLSSLYRVTNQYNKALAYGQAALLSQGKRIGKQNDEYASTLANLAAICLQMANYPLAEQYIKETLSIRAKLFSTTHHKYLDAIQLLGQIYESRQDYLQAEPLLEQAEIGRRQALGVNHPTYWYTLTAQARLSYAMGDTERAIHLDREVATRAGKANPGSEIHVSALNALLVDYLTNKQFVQADSTSLVGLEAVLMKLGKSSRFYSTLLHNRARVLAETKRTKQADSTYRLALDSYQHTVANQSEAFLSLLRSYAQFCGINKQAERADSLFNQCQLLTDKLFGPTSVRQAEITLTQALVAHAQQKPSQALAYSSRSNQIVADDFRRNFIAWSGQQRQQYLKRWMPSFHLSHSVYTHPVNYTVARGNLYDETLFLKNLLLNEHTQVARFLGQTSDSTLRASLDTLTTLKNNLATQLSKPIAQRQGIDSIQTQAEQVERRLARRSAGFRQAQQTLQTRWTDVRDALSAGEAAVEFVSFRHHTGHELSDTVRYMALVLRPGDAQPRLVNLFHEQQLRPLLASRLRGAGVSAGQTMAKRGSEVESDGPVAVDSLYRLIWQPIDGLLKGVRRVYVSPAGLVHQVPLATLRDGKKYLIERYDLRTVSSTRSVLAIKSETVRYSPSAPTVLYGGVQYSVDSTELRKLPKQDALTATRYRGPSDGKNWAYLPGTEREVSRIGRLLGSNAIVVQGRDATETHLKQLSGHSPKVLHVATHGFFFSDAKPTGDNAFRTAADPLLRSGLLMAGANHVWRGGQPIAGVDDGILTAYEVSNQNLTNTQLAVLSACETGQGEVWGSEGVFGLQRAFRMAGVQYVLMSLWQVPDQSTGVFMERFYRNWLKKGDLQTAFTLTQRQMSRQYPVVAWGAFVLIN